MPVGPGGARLPDPARAWPTPASTRPSSTCTTCPRPSRATVGDGSQCGLRVRYSWEHPLVLGSAGGPRHALPLARAATSLLIVNGDTLCDLPLRALWQAHQASGALVTLGLMPHPCPAATAVSCSASSTREARPFATRNPRPDTRLLAAGTVTGFVPRTSAVPSVHYPGIQFVRREVLAGLPDDTPAESVGEVYPAPDRVPGRARCGASCSMRRSTTWARWTTIGARAGRSPVTPRAT